MIWEKLETCDVTWDTPSADSAGSMPLGNGDIGVNLWVEKDNDVPSVDRRLSGHEKRSQCKQGYSHHGLIRDREKGFCKIHEFYIGKNERK
jgi:hypothetical protein